ncbi:nuclear transport factor 2 family protein [Amycolatopsis sp. NPDC026612]|uniref:nuclear transport factor 2 family protein n=1 Tax=Amycolatopsis sp. NPDC026612 TaxID=3155466 RepID=UPI003403D499
MAGSPTPLDVVSKYFEALSAKDFATVAGLFAGVIVWHRPGGNRFSGTHRGSLVVGDMIGGMMAVSDGTFELARSARRWSMVRSSRFPSVSAGSVTVPRFPGTASTCC